MSFTRFLSAYYLGRDLEEGAEFIQQTDLDEGNLIVTGEELISRIYAAIQLRRPVLVTGPRGSGKSYCSEQAIRRAAPLLESASKEEREKHPKTHIIGGWHYLQGNREIPRDYLSEDSLFIGSDKKPQFQRALVLRGRDKGESADDWPGIPTHKVSNYQAAMLEWDASDWHVLYLDEINRFGDGFLDSLLSLTEEGKIVRRGTEYYVPIVVVATANPPGYDATAKKLSPPLQARIARSFRVSQPPLEVLVDTVLKEMKARVLRTYQRPAAPPERTINSKKVSTDPPRPDVSISIDDELLYLAGAATLCLWGDPAQKLSGHYFLTRETREQLSFAVTLDPELAKALRTISKHVVFGPDSRAAADWLSAAAGLAYLEWEKAREKDPQRALQVEVKREHFRKTGLEVLSHKVRESFNEGTEPDKGILKEKCISLVVETLFKEGPLSDVQRLFVGSRAIASALEVMAVESVEAALKEAPKRGGADVAHLWRFAVATSPVGLLNDREGEPKDAEISRWLQALNALGFVKPDGRVSEDLLPVLEAVAALGKRGARVKSFSQKLRKV